MLGAPLEAGQRNKMSANLWERLFFECAIIDRWCLISHDMAISSTVSSQTKIVLTTPYHYQCGVRYRHRQKLVLRDVFFTPFLGDPYQISPPSV